VAGLNPDAASPELRKAAQQLHELDLREPGRLEDLITSHRQLDVLVNAAGIIRRGDEHRPEVFAEVVAVNLTGAMRAAEAAHELLARTRGCIVNVASMLSYFGGALVPGYSASKGGIVQLTKSLAVAWAAEGIRVNAVAPGWIATDLTAALQSDPVAAERILSRTPMARWGDPAEVAGAIAFLTGPDATFITGAVLAVDGGYQSA
jgi:NAD(P)-dependent dehydrogenase (short-subunit alcohol dehydrogenase family)